MNRAFILGISLLVCAGCDESTTSGTAPAGGQAGGTPSTMAGTPATSAGTPATMAGTPTTTAGTPATTGGTPAAGGLPDAGGAAAGGEAAGGAAAGGAAAGGAAVGGAAAGGAAAGGSAAGGAQAPIAGEAAGGQAIPVGGQANPMGGEPAPMGGQMNPMPMGGMPTPMGGMPMGFVDVDLDGINDKDDNCPGFRNPEQADRDGDNRGDGCDPQPDVFNYKLTGQLILAGGLSVDQNHTLKATVTTSAQKSASANYVLQGRLLP